MHDSVTHRYTRIGRVLGLTAWAVFFLTHSTAAQPMNAAVRAALDGVRADEPQVVDDQIRLCEIPAPPFQETARGQAMKAAFEQLGLANVRIDKAGNVLGDRPGVLPRPQLVVAAHLDTVFPEGTDVRVKRNGTILRGPASGTTAGGWPCCWPWPAR